MKDNELNLSQFSMRLNINVGTLSYLLNGNRTLTMDHLDRISEIMGVPIGHYYENYIHDYLQERNPDWRRVGPFLRKCAELDKLDCIRRTISLLMDNLMYSTSLFELAEEFYEKGLYAAAEILYENVAMSETRQYSERLAVCQYRLFKIRIGTDQAHNLKIAYQFEPYVDRLDEVLQLDALKDLANLYRSLRQWDRVEALAQEMEHKASIICFSERRSEEEFQKIQHRLSRPIFLYIAYSKLLCAAVYDGRGDYAKAMEYTNEYADLSWVRQTDEDTMYWKDQFQIWSRANLYANKIMSGEFEVLSEYVTYLLDNPDELITGLSNIMFAANRYHIDVDQILQEFHSKLEEYEHFQRADNISIGIVYSDVYNKLLYYLTYYYIHKGDYRTGFNYLMRGLENSVIINNESKIIKFMVLFEQHRSEASEESVLKYKNIISEVSREV
ncbi:helix-turn-helix domain-containing protein [Paenibacillus rhizolycopersici]|uniref:helix-turn-helix domain-containing protein n=1 Tax=Paenibacillus rhizolycopersici TaxID=2780073 RepID=UPI003D2AA3AB